MQTILLREILQNIKSQQFSTNIGLTGDYPVYSFKKGEKHYTDYPKLKGNGIIISKYNKPQILYAQGLFDVMPDCLYFMIKDEYTVDPKYIYFYLVANLDLLRRYYRGSVILTLSTKEFMNMQICIPSMAEQKRIVEMLSCLEDAKINRQRQMERFERFLAAYYEKMVSESSYKYWEEVNLGKLIKPGTRIRNIQSMESDPADDDLILTRNGISYVYSTKEKPDTNSNQSVCITLDKSQCNPHFIAAVLQYDKKVKAALMDRYSNKMTLGRNKLENVKLRLPSLSQQKDISAVVTMYYSIMAKLNILDSRLKALEKSLLYMIFRDKGKRYFTNKSETELVDNIYNKVQDCNIEEYDVMRDNVFHMLSIGKLVQYFDNSTKSIRLKENETDKS